MLPLLAVMFAQRQTIRFGDGPPPDMPSPALGIIPMLFFLAVMVFVIACQWKIFTKAGQPGWASIVPIYNLVVYLNILGMPLWWLALILIPCVNFIGMPAFAIMSSLQLAKSFGKDIGFAIGLIFLGIVFMPILAFGDAQYVGPGDPNAMPGQKPRGPGGVPPRR